MNLDASLHIASRPATPGQARTAVTNPQGIPKRIVAATVAGNALEFYDFVTYAFFAVYIGKTFFPASTPLGSLLLSVAVFGVGFVSRPLGGVLIGAFADRAGRKPAMLLTMGLVIIGTLAPAQVQSWGWRVPFAVGLLLLPVAFYLRREMPETLHAAPAQV